MLRRPLLAAALLCTSAAACNALTGVDDLSLPGARTGPATAGAGASTGPGAGAGGQGGSTMPGIQMLPAQGVTIDEIAIYQGVKRDLVGGTPPTSGVVVPIVAGRDALVRVFVKTDATYDGSPVTAHLTLGAAAPLEVVGAVGPSTDAALGSTINFDVPGASLVAGLTYRVTLTQPSPHGTGMNPGATSPATGSAPLDVTSDGPQIKIALVPVKYAADGSNRLPDTSAAQLQGYKDKFLGTYPIVALDLQMHAPWASSVAIGADGTGWSELLDALAALRQQEGAPLDLYYFGIFQPAASFDDFCGGGCVAGLGMIGDAQDNMSRAAIGLGYSGDTAFTTAIHEVGHTQGRSHAPCGGAQNVDPSFPYSTGGIGVWGYDLIAKQLIPPTVGHDMMGYCDNDWISDYTFNAIFQRMKIVNQAEIIVPDDLKNLTWERVRLDGQGGAVWLTPLTMARPPLGEAVPVTVHTALGPAGAAVVEGQFFPYDHLPGGVLLWQKAKAPVSGIEVTLAGKVSSLTR